MIGGYILNSSTSGNMSINRTCSQSRNGFPNIQSGKEYSFMFIKEKDIFTKNRNLKITSFNLIRLLKSYSLLS